MRPRRLRTQHSQHGGRPMAGDWMQQFEKRINDLETQNAVAAVQHANVGARLGAIEDTLKWLVRLVIGGLLMGAMAYVLRGGIAG